MNLEELRALTPEQRDAILAKQAESLTPVERLMVYLNLDNHEDDAQAVAIVDDLMIAYVLTEDPLTPGAEELRDMLVEVAETWLKPNEALAAEIRETDALKVRLVESNNRVKDNEIQITRMTETIRSLRRKLDQAFPRCYDAAIGALSLAPADMVLIESAIARVQNEFND